MNIMLSPSHPIIKLDCIDSTLNYASEKLDASNAEELTVVWTANQYAGIGQAGNIWESEPEKNICYSILFYPHFLSPSHQFMLTKVLSLGVSDVLKSYVDPSLVKIKWPNDLWIGTHKIAGILFFNKIKGAIYERATAGLGFNVNQICFSELIPNATSLKILTGKDYLLDPIVNELTYSISKYYALLRQNKIQELDALYLENLLFFKEFKTYMYRGKAITAMIEGVDEYGFLQLKTKDMQTISCDLKEIKYLF